MALRACRRKGFFSSKDPHERQQVKHADEGVVGREAKRMMAKGWTDEVPHTKVKRWGEPTLDGEECELDWKGLKEREPK